MIVVIVLPIVRWFMEWSVWEDINEGMVYCGRIGGMIMDIKTAKEVIDDIIDGAKKLVGELAKLG